MWCLASTWNPIISWEESQSKDCLCWGWPVSKSFWCCLKLMDVGRTRPQWVIPFNGMGPELFKSREMKLNIKSAKQWECVCIHSFLCPWLWLWCWECMLWLPPNDGWWLAVISKNKLISPQNCFYFFGHDILPPTEMGLEHKATFTVSLPFPQ